MSLESGVRQCNVLRLLSTRTVVLFLHHHQLPLPPQERYDEERGRNRSMAKRRQARMNNLLPGHLSRGTAHCTLRQIKHRSVHCRSMVRATRRINSAKVIQKMSFKVKSAPCEDKAQLLSHNSIGLPSDLHFQNYHLSSQRTTLRSFAESKSTIQDKRTLCSRISHDVPRKRARSLRQTIVDTSRNEMSRVLGESLSMLLYAKLAHPAPLCNERLRAIVGTDLDPRHARLHPPNLPLPQVHEISHVRDTQLENSLQTLVDLNQPLAVLVNLDHDVHQQPLRHLVPTRRRPSVS